MELIDFKDRLNRIKFFVSNLRYHRPRHLYIAVFLIIIIISVSITILFLKQKDEIRKKENILKSYYTKFDYSTEDQLGKKGLTESSLDKEHNNEIKIKVYVCGFVKNPGVYEIQNGARIIDLLSLCGGAVPEACLEVVNLAQKINDGDMVYIPSKEEVKDRGIAFFTGGYITNGNLNIDGEENPERLSIININTATKEELEILPGIGEQTAQNIIDYRNKYGFFKTKEEIKNVKGIGEKKYEKIKDMIMI
jgi:competence protein ComEA